MNKNILTMLVAFVLVGQVSFGDVWEDIARYSYGDDPNPCAQAESILQETPPARYGPIEQKLIAVVASKDATQAGKAFACRFLQQVGTEKCIAAVSGLLDDEVLSDYARLVLERLRCAAADKAMRQALVSAPDKAKVGILGSLGERRDAKAVKAVAGLANSADRAVAAAAIQALGKIGGRQAAQYLLSMTPPQELGRVRMQAMVQCAGSLSGRDAAALCRKVLAGNDAPCRIAALRELTKADPAKASSLIADALKGNDLKLRRGALSIIAQTKGASLTRAMVALAAGLPDEGKAQLITALGARGDTVATGPITGYLDSPNAAVRDAAVKALGKLGDAGMVLPLLAAAADAPESEKAVIAAIVAMKDESVDAVLVDSLNNPRLRRTAIRTCIARGCTEAVGALLKLVKDTDADVRKDAWAGLAALADEDDMNSIMQTVVAIRNTKDLACAEGAIKEVFSRAGDKGGCFQVVAGNYRAGTDALKHVIIDLAALVGDSTALNLERNALRSGDKELYARALRALAKWPNESAAEDLLEQAGNAAATVDRIVALRGYIRIAGMDTARLSAGERMKMLKTALTLAGRTDEKKQIAAALQQVRNLKALEMLKEFMDDPAVRPEAEMSAANLIWQLYKKHPAETEAMARQLVNSGNRSVADRAKRTLAELKKAGTSTR